MTGSPAPRRVAPRVRHTLLPHGIAASATAELQELLLATEDITGFLDHLATLAVTVLPADTSCGITLRRDHGAMTVASSDTRASQVDEIQYGHDEGPCLHSLRTGQVVVVDDLAGDDRWGAYRMPALGHGVRSSLSLPLRTNGEVIGALNIYATRRRLRPPRNNAPPAGSPTKPPAPSHWPSASPTAPRCPTICRRRSSPAPSSTKPSASSWARTGAPPTRRSTSCAVLRRTSQNRNIKLRDIAADMVTAVSGRPPADDPRFS